jgi:hypothetical protein
MSEPRTEARATGGRKKTTSHGCPLDFPKPRQSALAAIKREALRLAGNGTREGFLFSERLFRALPELREV